MCQIGSASLYLSGFSKSRENYLAVSKNWNNLSLVDIRKSHPSRFDKVDFWFKNQYSHCSSRSEQFTWTERGSVKSHGVLGCRYLF